ncbi:phosphotransferase [Paenibacillus sp. N3.4]|uniref:phosphotransferase n=1 Tax=Paenibacillus sp. N3.4 TaxID=2603222 RepID=UPI0011CB3A0D|nr:phosphotransferase [Paenibacillus sp. N3.4]TXK75922.1 phosphotransferase [Paenibacillus sp. N3.4]
MLIKDQEELLSSLPAHWFPGKKWSMRIGTGGMNNTTRFVAVEGTTYVMRLYETHRDLDKIIFEHHILLALAKYPLPYRLPIPIQLPSGETVVRLDDEQGKLAALFSYTEGYNPTWEHLFQLKPFGKAVGQLSKALSTIHVAPNPVYPPYYEIEHIHPRCSPEAIREFCLRPSEAFLFQREMLTYIYGRFAAFYEAIPTLRKLPHQLVHGDINGSNMLVDAEGQIAAVLDFEFVTWDLRVMELAVCLSDLIDPTLPEEVLRLKCSAFYEGYRASVCLEETEYPYLPLLIELRRLDVFVHFLGRYFDGVDAQGVLVDIIHNTYDKTRWLQSYGVKLIQDLSK